MAWLLVRQIGIGLAVGAAVGAATIAALRRAPLDTGGLYPVATLAAAALAFGGADTLHGSGFLAVYITGLALGTAGIPAQRTVTSFHQGLAWVAQVVLFLSLGLLVFPSDLGSIAVQGTVLALVVVFVARPIAVWLATALADYSTAERTILTVAGLRGAVPVVLATFPVIAGVKESNELFNIVFFAVLISTVLQGASFEPLAERLGVTTREPALPRPLAEAGTIRALGAEVLEFPIGAGDAIAGHRVRDLDLPREAVVNVIVRGNEAIPPRGSTRLLAGDELHLLVRSESAGEVGRLMRRWRDGPVGPPPRPERNPRGAATVLSVRPYREGIVEGDLSRPRGVGGEAAVAQLRIRRDTPGALVALADGRYALTGPLIVVGSRRDITQFATRRMRRLPRESPERPWLQNVIGAMASDLPE
jgi:cell volume regulation protein A